MDNHFNVLDIYFDIIINKITLYITHFLYVHGFDDKKSTNNSVLPNIINFTIY